MTDFVFDKTKKYINYVITIYNMDNIVRLQDKEVKYSAYGDEICPTTGRPHKQAFVFYKNARYWESVRKLFLPDHIEPMMGNFEQNKRYCSKTGTYHEYGTKPLTKIEQGEKGDAYFRMCIDLAKEGRKDEIPAKVYISHKRTWDQIEKEAYSDTNNLTCDIIELRPWQKNLVEYIEGPIHNREIMFIVDSTGGAGKTQMGVYLMKHHGAQVLTPGKRCDIYYNIKPGKVFIFDCSAADMKDLDQGMLEEIKNGYFISTKYEPRKVCMPRPHVIVFCNNMVQCTLVPDRIKIVEI